MLGDVNVVSAPVVAKERGMVVDEVVRAADGDYESLITVTVTTERQERSVSGTVYADGAPRLVDIKGIRVDAEFGKSMIYVTNEDKPGFIGKFASLLGDRQGQHRDLPSRPQQAGRRTPSRWSRSMARCRPMSLPRWRRCRRSSRPRRFLFKRRFRFERAVVFADGLIKSNDMISV